MRSHKDPRLWWRECRHTSINRSISADHALAQALEFNGKQGNLKKVSSFHYLTMYLNYFVPKTKHNCGCISQVCIYNGIFRFWSALCGLLGDKCSPERVVLNPEGFVLSPEGDVLNPEGFVLPHFWDYLPPEGVVLLPDGN